MLYYRWFLKDFLNQSISVNEEFINSLSTENEKFVQNQGPGEEFDDNMTLDRKPFYSDTLIAHIRMDLISPGEIVSISKSCFNFTGYEQAELVKQKINKLMPKVIANAHDIILRQFITLGITFTSNIIGTYMLVKDGTLKPVNLLIKLYYQVYGNIEMVGLFRENKHRVENPEVILFENNGVRSSHARPSTP